MVEALSGLSGVIILGMQKTHDYWQITTEKGVINIYNPAQYYAGTGACLDLEHVRLSDIMNRVVTNIVECEKHLYFRLDDNSSVAISLAENDYGGPEAFDIHLDTGTIIVG